MKPNEKLKEFTSYPYAMFYISTQATNILVDFENSGHLALINLLVSQDYKLKVDQELSRADISKGKRLFLKVLGEKVVYSKYNGADCSFRLASKPSTDIHNMKQEWLGSNNLMEIFTLNI